jgi:two-component system OmpR family response regulator
VAWSKDGKTLLAQSMADKSIDVFSFDGKALKKTGNIKVPNGAQVSLSKGEYALLLAFLDAPQRPLTREQLLQATRVHEDIFDRSIDVQVLRLRVRAEVRRSDTG